MTVFFGERQPAHPQTRRGRPPFSPTIDLAPAPINGLGVRLLANRQDVMDIAQVAAMFNFTNRLASTLGWVPNEEYFTLGR